MVYWRTNKMYKLTDNCAEKIINFLDTEYQQYINDGKGTIFVPLSLQIDFYTKTIHFLDDEGNKMLSYDYSEKPCDSVTIPNIMYVHKITLEYSNK